MVEEAEALLQKRIAAAADKNQDSELFGEEWAGKKRNAKDRREAIAFLLYTVSQVKKLISNTLDIGFLRLPLSNEQLRTTVIHREPFLLVLDPIVLTQVEIEADRTPSPPPGADNQQYGDTHGGNLPAV